MRCLVYSDSPTAPTGFGTVVRNIFLPLHERRFFSDLIFYGVNYYGDPHPLPCKIYPAQIAGSHDRDLYGRQRFAHLLLQNAWQFDAVFFLSDHFTLASDVQFPDGRVEPFLPGLLRRLREQVQQGQRNQFRVIQYIPVDSDTLLPHWVSWIPDLIDLPVAYTRFGARVLLEMVPALENKLTVIPHGTNPEVFHPVAPEVRAQFRQNTVPFNLGPDAPLIINVNRNQPRKDVPRTIQAFAKVLKRYPNAKLYLHMNMLDSAGFNLERVRLTCRVPHGKVIYPGNFSEGVGMSLEQLNLLYNAADVFVTTARGEGWGLTMGDAMTVGLPCVAPNHTSHSELLADGRGLLVPCEPERQIFTQDNDQLRPVVDVTAMASAICYMLDHREEANAMAGQAQQWALNLSWREHVVPQWERLFVEMQRSLMPSRRSYALNAAASHGA